MCSCCVALLSQQSRHAPACCDVGLCRSLAVALSPVGALYDPKGHIESCRVYGNIDEYAYYYADLMVGTPPQRVSVILDTGSGVAAFPCASCPHCGEHIDPAFDYAKSSTAKWEDYY